MIDIKLAIQLARACCLAYCDGAEAIQASEHLEPSGLSDIKQFTTSDGRDSVIVGRIGEKTVVAFRGTVESDVSDWLNDADCEMVGIGDFRLVHAGFLNSLNALYPLFKASLTEDGDFIFTGHSKGGPLAGLMAHRCAINDDLIVTFGSPKWCNQALADEWAEENGYYRFENGPDIVPHLPELPGYVHVGQTCWLDPLGNLITDDSENAYRELNFFGAMPSGQVEAHLLPNYLNALQKLI